MTKPGPKAVIAYMGLIKQCDDQLARVAGPSRRQPDRAQDTVIVLTSDHGDYLGDHWLGEKDLFARRICQGSAGHCRPLAPGRRNPRHQMRRALVEQIDLAATFIEMAGERCSRDIGSKAARFFRSCIRHRAGELARLCDRRRRLFRTAHALRTLGLDSGQARLFMVFDGRYKLVHSAGGHPPMLFDLQTDPQEFDDLGNTAGHAATRDEALLHHAS